jgi:hypothetical protein
MGTAWSQTSNQNASKEIISTGLNGANDITKQKLEAFRNENKDQFNKDLNLQDVTNYYKCLKGERITSGNKLQDCSNNKVLFKKFFSEDDKAKRLANILDRQLDIGKSININFILNIINQIAAEKKRGDKKNLKFIKLLENFLTYFKYIQSLIVFKVFKDLKMIQIIQLIGEVIGMYIETVFNMLKELEFSRQESEIYQIPNNVLDPANGEKLMNLIESELLKCLDSIQNEIKNIDLKFNKMVSNSNSTSTSTNTHVGNTSPYTSFGPPNLPPITPNTNPLFIQKGKGKKQNGGIQQRSQKKYQPQQQQQQQQQNKSSDFISSEESFIAQRYSEDLRKLKISYETALLENIKEFKVICTGLQNTVIHISNILLQLTIVVDSQMSKIRIVNPRHLQNLATNAQLLRKNNSEFRDILKTIIKDHYTNYQNEIKRKSIGITSNKKSSTNAKHVSFGQTTTATGSVPAPGPRTNTTGQRTNTTGQRTNTRPVNATGTPPVNATGTPPVNATGTPPGNATGTPPGNATGTPPVNATGTPPGNPANPGAPGNPAKPAKPANPVRPASENTGAPAPGDKNEYDYQQIKKNLNKTNHKKLIQELKTFQEVYNETNQMNNSDKYNMYLDDETIKKIDNIKLNRFNIETIDFTRINDTKLKKYKTDLYKILNFKKKN